MLTPPTSSSIVIVPLVSQSPTHCSSKAGWLSTGVRATVGADAPITGRPNTAMAPKSMYARLIRVHDSTERNHRQDCKLIRWLVGEAGTGAGIPIAYHLR